MNFKTIIIFLTIFNSSVSVAQSKINWLDIPYKEALIKAKENNKYLLIYFYFKGCSACLKMEKDVFIDENVANFYNDKFICMTVDIKTEDGGFYKSKFKTIAYPTFVYLSNNGTELHRLIGYYAPLEFINQGKNAISKSNSLYIFKKEFTNGNREKDFLIKYIYALDNNWELDKTLIRTYLDLLDSNELSDSQNVKFIFHFSDDHFQSFFDIYDREFRFMLSNQNLFRKYFEPEQVDVRILSTAMHAARHYAKLQNEKNFNDAINIVEKYNSTEEYWLKTKDSVYVGYIGGIDRVANLRMYYYALKGDKKQFEYYENELTEKIKKNDPYELVYLAKDYSEEFTDPYYLEKACSWIKDVPDNDSDYLCQSTYTNLLYKLGKYEEALKEGRKAINLAKSEKVDHKDIDQLMDEIYLKLKSGK